MIRLKPIKMNNLFSFFLFVCFSLSACNNAETPSQDSSANDTIVVLAIDTIAPNDIVEV